MSKTKVFFDKWVDRKGSQYTNAKSNKWAFLTWLHGEFVEAPVCDALMETAVRANTGIAYDAGCGDGTYTLLLAKRTTNMFVVSCDLSLKSLQAAKRKIKANSVKNKVDFVQCDISSSPFRENSFDLAMVINVIHHLPNLTALKDIRSVLQQQGRVLVLEVTADNPIIEFARILFLALPHQSKSAFSDYECVVDSEVAEAKHYPAEALKKSIHDANFKEVSEKRLGLFNFVFWYFPTLAPGFLRIVNPPALIAIFRIENKLSNSTPLRRFCCNILLSLKINNLSSEKISK